MELKIFWSYVMAKSMVFQLGLPMATDWFFTYWVFLIRRLLAYLAVVPMAEIKRRYSPLKESKDLPLLPFNCNQKSWGVFIFPSQQSFDFTKKTFPDNLCLKIKHIGVGKCLYSLNLMSNRQANRFVLLWLVS